MDYDLTAVVEAELPYSSKTTSPYGELPAEMLIAKFEETNVEEDEEELHHEYARSTLKDKRADPYKFEHERPRGGVNKSTARLQLQYYGHRGNVDLASVYRPEHFDGFIGPEDADPRGTSLDPDMRQLRRQMQARMRFISFNPDKSEHTDTSGERSAQRLMKDKQTVFQTAKNKLKIFSRQLGTMIFRPAPQCESSSIPRQVVTRARGDRIDGNDGVTTQRRAVIIAEEIIKNTRRWRDNMNDTDFDTIDYRQYIKHAHIPQGDSSALDMHDTDAKFASAESSKVFKAAGLILADIVKQRQAALDSGDGDIDMGDTRAMVAAKSATIAALRADLHDILQGILYDNTFGDAITSVAAKSVAPHAERRANLTEESHLLPAHHYLNASIIYKSIRAGDDPRKIADKIVYDTKRQVLSGEMTRIAKSAKKLMREHKLPTEEETDKAESKQVFNYSGLRQTTRGPILNGIAAEEFTGRQVNTVHRKSAACPTEDNLKRDAELDIEFANNQYKDRYVGPARQNCNIPLLDREKLHDGIVAEN